MAAKIRFWLTHYIVGVLLRGVKIEVNGLENLPENQGFVIASSHKHDWDPVLIMLGLKRHIHFLSIDSNFTKDFFSGLTIRFMQQMPVSRKNKIMNKNAILRAASYIKSGEIVGIFPEGDLEQKKKKIFPGIAIIAQKSNSKIVPIFIKVDAPRSYGINTNFSHVKIIIGKPIKFRKSVGYTKNLAMKKIYGLKRDRL